MSDTKIQWTNKTWNCIRGCSRVSAGCARCYAERQAVRQVNGVYAGLVKSTKAGPRWTGAIAMDEKALLAPLRWRPAMEHSEECEKALPPYSTKGHIERGCRELPLRIFVNSMSDLFHEAIPDEFIDKMFAVMALCPQHTFQILTKRAERMHEYLSHPERCFRVWMAMGYEPFMRMGCPMPKWPLPNVWNGVSVENQATADERIPLLLQTPAAVRWISGEPLLGALEIRDWVGLECRHEASYSEPDTNATVCRECDEMALLDWVVVGGESGPQARPCNIEWIRSVVKQCKAANVPCFVKQLGAKPFLHRKQSGEQKLPGGSLRFSSLEIETEFELNDRKGGDPAEWPEDLRVREYPGVRQ